MVSPKRAQTTTVYHYNDEGKLISLTILGVPICPYCLTPAKEGGIKYGKKTYHKTCFGLEVTS
jgi:hypothetical protein